MSTPTHYMFALKIILCVLLKQNSFSLHIICDIKCLICVYIYFYISRETPETKLLAKLMCDKILLVDHHGSFLVKLVSIWVVKLVKKQHPMLGSIYIMHAGNQL